MKHLHKLLSLLLILSLALSCLIGCSKKEVICPFTKITWQDTLEDIQKLEGKDYEEGESLYYGECYNYPKEFKGVTGTLQYMFDEEDKLACMAWLYSSDSLEEIETLYKTLHEDLEAEYGKGKYDSQFASEIGGDVWYQDGGNIILLLSTVDEYKAIQLSYVSPEHSLDEPK